MGRNISVEECFCGSFIGAYRLGCVLRVLPPPIFLPLLSGAGGCDGYTFVNGLRK